MEQPFIDIMQSLSLSSDPQITSPFVVVTKMPVVDVVIAVVEFVVVIVVVLSATVVASVEEIRRAVVGVTSVGVVISDEVVVESICFSVKTVVLSPAHGGIVDVTFSFESVIGVGGVAVDISSASECVDCDSAVVVSGNVVSGDVVSGCVVSAVVVGLIFVFSFVVSIVVDDSPVDELSLVVIVLILS